MTTAPMASDAADGGRPSVWRATVEAAVLAASANTFVYLAGSRADLFPQHVLIPGLDAPITLGRTVAATLAGVAAGGVTLALLRRWSARAWPTFQWLAAVVLLITYTQPPLVLPHAPPRMMLALNLMHTVAAAIAVVFLGRAVPPNAR